MSILGCSTRSLITGLLVVGLAAAPVAPATADAPNQERRPQLPQRIELPDGFQPEGITIRGGPTAYLGSRGSGDIYAANLRTGNGRVISEGDGTAAVGLKLDPRGRLWVAGGSDGDAKVVNSRNGRVVATYDFTDAPSFVNDVVLTRHAAWFTDSRRAVLYRVPLDRHGHQRRFRELPLRGDWQQLPDVNNANGISTTPDGRALLVVQSATGFLFRVHKQTGRATRVHLGATTLVNGDGMLRRGRILYVVQNGDNKVAVLRLGRHGWAGHLARSLTSPGFDIPTTVASYRKGLYLPNARFGIPAPETADYWITRIHR